jgi:hypothetical protein
MELKEIISRIAESSADVLQLAKGGNAVHPLGLRRSARLPWLAALHQTLVQPILLLTDRNDHALMLADELSLWTPDVPRLFFPEPNPLFYEFRTTCLD